MESEFNAESVDNCDLRTPVTVVIYCPYKQLNPEAVTTYL